jgi:hypothetical protein
MKLFIGLILAFLLSCSTLTKEYSGTIYGGVGMVGVVISKPGGMSPGTESEIKKTIVASTTTSNGSFTLATDENCDDCYIAAFSGQGTPDAFGYVKLSDFKGNLTLSPVSSSSLSKKLSGNVSEFIETWIEDVTTGAFTQISRVTMNGATCPPNPFWVPSVSAISKLAVGANVIYNFITCAIVDNDGNSTNMYTLNTESSSGGSVVEPQQASIKINELTTFDLAAIPNSGYNFKTWTVVVGQNNININNVTSAITTAVLTGGDATIRADFVQIPTPNTFYSLTISAGTGGSVSPTSAQASSSAAAIVTATANTNYVFSNWTVISGSPNIDNSNSSATIVTLSGNSAIQANFVLKAVTYNPTVTVSPLTGSKSQNTFMAENGTGFHANAQITLHFTDPNGIKYPAAGNNSTNSTLFPISDANGKFIHSFNPTPQTAIGTWTYYATSDAGDVSNTVSFYIVQ